jgi:hypothetical protein
MNLSPSFLSRGVVVVVVVVVLVCGFLQLHELVAGKA